MRVGFAGTPEFSKIVLSKLLAQQFAVSAVLTQPDRPAGRGMQVTASPVKQLAEEHKLPVFQPVRLRAPKNIQAISAEEHHEIERYQNELSALELDVLVVVAYGLILPEWLLKLPKYGCLNIHASLLPRWRGAAPIQRAIEAGDKSTGVTIMQMDAGLDTGDMLLSGVVDIASDMSSQKLHDVLAELGADLLLEVLGDIEKYRAGAKKQPQEGVNYAEKIKKEEAQLEWHEAAKSLEQKIRAFNPFPGVTLPIRGERYKIWRATIKNDLEGSEDGVPGEILSQTDEGIDIRTGQGVLRVLEIQRPGGKRMSVKDFLKGTKL